MKKLLIILGTIILSLIVTFIIFEMMSWYHFGDVPTKLVLIRLIACFCILEGLQMSIFSFINRKNK